MPFPVVNIGYLKERVSMKVGDLVSLKKTSLTADEHGEGILGIIVGYEDFLVHPWQVNWFKKNKTNAIVWEHGDDLVLISSVDFWGENESWKYF